MASSGVLLNILTEHEINSIPEDIRSKISSHFEEKFEEFLTSKALFESSRNKHGQNNEALEKELGVYKDELADTKSKFATAEQELEAFRSQLAECKSELSKLRETVKSLEYDNNELRRQRNDAVDERDTLKRMVERRDSELERLQTDIKTLSAELTAAVNAKCEALAAVEEIESKRAGLDFREKNFEQEKEFLSKKIASLSDELNSTCTELTILRRSHAVQDASLQSQLETKTEELRIAIEKDNQLTETNNQLVERVEMLAAKLMSQREAESAMAESYQQELQAKAKLAELYRCMSEDANAKSQELMDAIHSLQHLIEESKKNYDELQDKFDEAEVKYQESLESKITCIAALRKELKDANDLLKASKQETIEKTIEGLSPAAAAASKLIKSGLTLTQLYTQYASLHDELTLQKEENEKLNQHISKIAQEFEEKAPILQKQRENYENALESLAALSKQNDELVAERRRLREEAIEAKKIANHHQHENECFRKELADLSRQVCFLLKEVEEARGGVISMDDSTNVSLNGSLNASDIISKKLVTFRDIEDLQSNNQKLLALVRELSNKQEDLERTQSEIDFPTLQETIKTLNAEVAAVRENSVQQEVMIDQVVRQRDFYCNMYQKLVKGQPVQQVTDDSKSASPISSPAAKSVQPTVDSSLLAAKEQALQDAEKRIASSQKLLKELREEYDEYRKERRTNDTMMNEQIDKLRAQNADLVASNCKLSTQAEFQLERFKALQTNTSGLKAQITALEQKSNNYCQTIAKHEVSIKSLMEESMSAQSKLARAEVELDSLRQECSLLRDSEGRLRRDLEARERQSSSQAMLLANLETIRNAVERTETEGRLRAEQRLDDSVRECAALRRRLQEEQDHFRELAKHLEQKTATAVARAEEETKLADLARQDLETVRAELEEKRQRLDLLTEKLRDVARTPPVVVQRQDEKLAARARELEAELMASQSEARALRQQLEDAKKHLRQYTDIAEAAEQQVRQLSSLVEELRTDSEQKSAEAARTELQLNEELARLKEQAARLEAAGSRTSSDLQARNEELEMRCKELENRHRKAEESGGDLRNELNALRADLQGALQAQKMADEKYAREVTLHSEDIQVLTRVKEQLVAAEAQVADLREARLAAEEALRVGRAKYEDREVVMQRQLTELQERLEQLESQNAVLHDQIEALGTQLSVVQAQGKNVSPSKSPSSSTAGTEDDYRGSEQLLQVIKFLRREKQLAVTRMEVLSSENNRLRTEHDFLERQARESREALERLQQREIADTVTASRHQELLRKVETLNAITDSNRILRDERDALRLREQELITRLESLEQEISPLREQHSHLGHQVESLRSENTVLKSELTKWRQRTNQLIERANKNNPEDWKRLQNERESLAKQLTQEREALGKTEEELRGLRQEKTRVDEQLQALTHRYAVAEAELRKFNEVTKKHAEELTVMRARVSAMEAELTEHKTNGAKNAVEISRLNADIAARETKEQQIRKIAKKYKAQFEELKKSTDDERVAWEQQRAQHEAQAAAGQMTAEAKEQLREEGRREAEQRVRDLSTQVTSSQEEVGSLRKEIENFKNAEERAKAVLKNARSRIMQLTEAKTALEKQLNDSRTTSRDESEARLSVLKSQYEGRIARLEKEKNEALAERSREIENLSARSNHLQRLLESRSQGSSGHMEKSSSEPPTANIKPMAGPSSSSGKQQTQQSVTVLPWRANETPLASIRPMSLQSRMVAVQPCSQQSSGSTAVLMPLHHQQQSSQQQQQQSHSHQQQTPPTQQQPLQQAVHTTGTSSGAGAGAGAGVGASAGAGTSSTTNGAGTGGSGMDAISSSDYMPATSSASPASVAPSPTTIRQVAVPPTQQATVGPSTSRTEEASAESTQDMEVEGAERSGAQPQPPQQPAHAIPQMQVQGQGQQGQGQAQPQQQAAQPTQQVAQQGPPTLPQQAVAMVLPRERAELQQQHQQQQHQQPQQQLQQPQQQQALPHGAPQQPSQQQQQATQPSQAQQESHAEVGQGQGQFVVVAVSQPANSSNTVTTSQSSLKRPRDREAEGDSSASTSRAGPSDTSKAVPQLKRSRISIGGMAGGDPFQAPAESSECGGLDVEYQVPTSSQRDQEDDIIVVTSEEEDDEDEEGGEEEEDDSEGMADEGAMEEPDDGQEFQGDEDEENGFELEPYDREDRDIAIASYDDMEGPDIDDENGAEQDNEVEIIDDSNEVPNQPGSSSSSTGGPADATQHVGSSAPGPGPSTASGPGSGAGLGPASGPSESMQVEQPPPGQEQNAPPEQQQTSSEATSSGAATTSDNGSSNSSSGSGPGPGQGGRHGARSRTAVPPLNRQQQQQLLLPQGFEDGGDDCIVPSTPTLFVPRRTDGFGEAVSSPQAPSAGRFTFNESNPPAVRAVPCTPTLFGQRRAEGFSGRHFTFTEAPSPSPTPPSHTGVAQVVCEGMDDTRVDLSQLEDPGTGRSVPTTPLQVSPQGDMTVGELAGEVGQSSEGESAEASGSGVGPTITVTMSEHNQPIQGDAAGNAQREILELELENEPREAVGDALSGEQAEEPEDVLVLDLEEESGDGVSSEGSKPHTLSHSQPHALTQSQPQPSPSPSSSQQAALELELEEGREAEACEPAASSPQGSPNQQLRGSGTARRSQRGSAFGRRGGGGRGSPGGPSGPMPQRPTPIIWTEPGSTSPRAAGRGLPMMQMGRGMPSDRGFPGDRGFPTRGQRARRIRKSYGGPFNMMPY